MVVVYGIWHITGIIYNVVIYELYLAMALLPPSSFLISFVVAGDSFAFLFYFFFFFLGDVSNDCGTNLYILSQTAIEILNHLSLPVFVVSTYSLSSASSEIAEQQKQQQIMSAIIPNNNDKQPTITKNSSLFITY